MPEESIGASGDEAFSGLRAAVATLERGCSFLGRGQRSGAPAVRPGIDGGRCRSKVIGNGLRELDRFLSVVLDETALLIAPPGLDRAAFRRQRNTANKLRTIRGAMAVPSPDHDRLLAIGRSRECFFNCDGIVRRGDHRSAGRMTVGWLAPGSTELASFAIGERLILDAADLHGVCCFYVRVAVDLQIACKDYLANRLQ